MQNTLQSGSQGITVVPSCLTPGITESHPTVPVWSGESDARRGGCRELRAGARKDRTIGDRQHHAPVVMSAPIITAGGRHHTTRAPTNLYSASFIDLSTCVHKQPIRTTYASSCITFIHHRETRILDLLIFAPKFTRPAYRATAAVD